MPGSSAQSGCRAGACWPPAAGTGARALERKRGSCRRLLHGRALARDEQEASKHTRQAHALCLTLLLPARSTLRLWDPRAAPGAAQVACLALPGKAYSMSASGERLVVAMAGRTVDIYDLRT